MFQFKKKEMIPRLVIKSIIHYLRYYSFCETFSNNLIFLNSFSSFLSAVMIPITNKMSTDNYRSWYHCLFTDQIVESIHFPMQQLFLIFSCRFAELFWMQKLVADLVTDIKFQQILIDFIYRIFFDKNSFKENKFENWLIKK